MKTKIRKCTLNLKIFLCYKEAKAEAEVEAEVEAETEVEVEAEVEE